VGFVACIFLSALDQVCPSVPWILSHLTRKVPKTIIATALPTIVSQLGGGSRYSWVGRFVFSLSIKVTDRLLHALVPTCWPQPGPFYFFFQ
jgi:hypothetical protein